MLLWLFRLTQSSLLAGLPLESSICRGLRWNRYLNESWQKIVGVWHDDSMYPRHSDRCWLTFLQAKFYLTPRNYICVVFMMRALSVNYDLFFRRCSRFGCQLKPRFVRWVINGLSFVVLVFKWWHFKFPDIAIGADYLVFKPNSPDTTLMVYEWIPLLWWF